MLTLDDFDFLIAMLNDVSLELAEKKEAKKRNYSTGSRENSKKRSRNFSLAK
jgi:hypothetical protein